MTSTSVRHLNFLDERSSAPKQFFALNYLSMIVLAAILGAAGSGYSLFQKHRLTSMQDQLTTISAELTQLRAAQMQKQQANLSETARKQVLGDPILWSNLLRKMAKKIPEAVKLSQINGTITSKRTLVLKGISSFLLPIFRLKDNFQGLKECSKPSLVSIEQAQLSGGEEQLSFQMECTLS